MNVTEGQETLELLRQARAARVLLKARWRREGWPEIRTPPEPGRGGRRPIEAVAPDAVVLVILAGPKRRLTL